MTEFKFEGHFKMISWALNQINKKTQTKSVCQFSINQQNSWHFPHERLSSSTQVMLRTNMHGILVCIQHFTFKHLWVIINHARFLNQITCSPSYPNASANETLIQSTSNYSISNSYAKSLFGNSALKTKHVKPEFLVCTPQDLLWVH